MFKENHFQLIIVNTFLNHVFKLILYYIKEKISKFIKYINGEEKLIKDNVLQLTFLFPLELP